MPPRSVRLTLIAVGTAAALIWWLPALAVRLWLPQQLVPEGIEASLDGVWPNGLMGVRIDRLAFTSGSTTLSIENVRARFDGDGWDGEARVAGGRITVRARRDGRVGLAYFRNIEIEPMVAFAAHALPLRARGRLHGVVRWSDAVEVSAHLRDAIVDLPVIGILRMEAIDTLITRLASGAIQIDEALAVGPSGDLAAAGTIGAQQDLSIELRVARLEPRLVQLVRELRPDLADPPTSIEITGTALRPMVLQKADLSAATAGQAR